MTEKIDLSLDDIIKINKKKGGAGKPRAGGPANNASHKSKIRPKVQQQQQSRPARVQPPRQQEGPAMLHVANLHFNVSDKDLRDLFQEIGRIKKAAIHYDKSGRSLGTAEVIFWQHNDAIRAIKEYNSRILDGRPMNITLVPSRNPITTNISPPNKSMGVKKGSGIQKRSPPKVGSRLKNQTSGRSPRKNLPNKGPNRGKPSRQPKEKVSVEDLDRELEAYTSNKMNVD